MNLSGSERIIKDVSHTLSSSKTSVQRGVKDDKGEYVIWNTHEFRHFKILRVDHSESTRKYEVIDKK